MRNLLKTLPVLISIIAALGLSDPVRGQDAASGDGIEFFETKIRPVLVRECYGCHSTQADTIKGGLQLDSRSGLLLGGDSGAALVPGSLEDSPLWSAINYEDYAMPPNEQLAPEIIEDFAKWIEMGAPHPDSQTQPTTVRSTVSKQDIENGKRFWSFQKPARPTLPAVAADWPATEIDQFVYDKLKSKSLQPAADAEPLTILRRLCFDLVGLPPSPEQIKWFIDQWQEDPERAMEKAIDLLLASQRFGERWGRHWLDVARYAESSGKELNATYPHAWRYRDYVIDSFNADKPYDRFVQEQIAGDLLPVNTDRQWSDNLVATGFLAIGPKTLIERNPRQFEADLVDEQIDVTTRVILGVSVACARCHDHKFDPIPQSDYYAMAGIFQSTYTYYGTLNTQQNRRPSNLILLPHEDLSPQEKPISEQDLAKLTERHQALTDQYQDLARQRRQARRDPESVADPQQINRQFNAVAGQRTAIEAVLSAYDESGNPKTFCMGVQAADTARNATLLERGEIDQPAQEIPRGFVQVLADRPARIRNKSTGRLELAKWMTSRDNPLAARVMVNRIWHHMMGRGIVETTENFGATGQPPTHPELLDYLAIKFMEDGWSIKNMIRHIATSRTYRMSSTFDNAGFQLDPDNKFYWRSSPTRLDAESIRDSMLAISGQLRTTRPRASDVARAGQTVARDGRLRSAEQLLAIRLPGDNTNMQTARNRRRRSEADAPQSDPMTRYRSVYLPIVRDSVPRSLAVFDFAESSMVVGVRESSNTPDQGLYFLNNPFVTQQSEELAKRVMKESSVLGEQIDYAFLLAYGRHGTSREVQAAHQFYQEFEVAGRDRKLKKMASLCQSIMASAEFRIVN